MKRIIERSQNFLQPLFRHFSTITGLKFSIISLLVISLSYLPFINKVGYFLDDWPQLYSWQMYGLEGLKQYWAADSRWFTWWIQGLLFPVLGTRPIFWHLTMLVLRWVASVLFWLILKKIWPKSELQITAAALLFGIYPLFVQQSSAVMFAVIWICLILYFVSVLLMIQATITKKWFVPLTLAGLLIAFVHLFSYEYFFGLELLRPFIFVALINREEFAKKKKVTSIVLHSLPWLVLDFAYLIWRGFLIKVPTLRSANIISELINAPMQTLVGLLETMVKDFIQVVMSTWYNTLLPSLFDFQKPSDIFAWMFGVVAFVAVLILLIQLNRSAAKTEERTHKWAIQALWIGSLAVVLGAAPAWAGGRSVSAESGIWNDRFGIASMFGASLFLVGLVISLIKPTRNRAIFVLAFLMALATSSNIRATNEYRWSSTYQNRFYNQLVWRAPAIQPNTTLLADKELFTKMGVYPTSFAINLLYPHVNTMPQMDFWFFTIEHYFQNNYHDLDQGIEISLDKWYFKYRGLSTDSLVIYWDYQAPSCLWMLDQNDRYNPYVSDVTREVLGASNLSRIIDQPAEGYPPEDIFGDELGHGWCYYFEKADLAKQLQQWESIPAMYEETIARGYNTNFGPELTPFIFGYAMTGDTNKAVELTHQAKTMAEKMNPYLCDQWQAIYDLAEPTQALEDAYQGMMTDLRCGI